MFRKYGHFVRLSVLLAMRGESRIIEVLSPTMLTGEHGQIMVVGMHSIRGRVCKEFT